MNNKNRWKDFFKERGSVLLLFALAIVSSTLYAIYLKQNQRLELGYLEQYLHDSSVSMKLDIKCGIQIFIGYYKKYLIVWMLGLVSFLTPIVVVGTFLEVFAYGFSIATLYLGYGKEGVLIASCLFVLQGVIINVLLLELLNGILKKNQIFNVHVPKNYGLYLIEGGVGCILVVLVEIFILNLV